MQASFGAARTAVGWALGSCTAAAAAVAAAVAAALAVALAAVAAALALALAAAALAVALALAAAAAAAAAALAVAAAAAAAAAETYCRHCRHCSGRRWTRPARRRWPWRAAPTTCGWRPSCTPAHTDATLRASCSTARWVARLNWVGS